MVAVVNIHEVLSGHVSLQVDCVDRLYLNAYCPVLQVGGQVVCFLTGHLGNPIPSPAVFTTIGNRFRREVDRFAAGTGIPLLRLKKPDRSRWDDRKLDHVRPYLDRAAVEGRFGVVAIVVAQEFQWVTGARNRSPKPGVVSYDFVKEERRVSAYYFYVHDQEFGPGFIKICSYFPYPAKVWLNGHEWAKRQAGQEGLSYAALANGFAACPEPARLQAICDRFGPSDAQAFFDRWTAVIPVPFTAADRAAGYWWQLSMRQVEVRLLMIERAGQGCAIGSALFERIHQPYAREGQRTGALRFGDQRAMALAGALCLVVHAATGVTNKSLRGHVAGLLGSPYSSSQMSYDLRRLRLHGLIQRTPGTNSYTLTPEGIRVAVFYTKLHARLLRPLLEANQPPAPIELRRALATIEHVLSDYITNARLGAAA